MAKLSCYQCLLQQTFFKIRPYHVSKVKVYSSSVHCMQRLRATFSSSAAWNCPLAHCCLQERLNSMQSVNSIHSVSNISFINRSQYMRTNPFQWRQLLPGYADIIDEIKNCDTVENLFITISKRISVIKPPQIVAAFVHLSSIIENSESLPSYTEPCSLVHHDEFVNLCILAENLVHEFSNEELISMVTSLLKLCGRECLSLSNALQTVCHHRLDSMNHDQLSQVAMWFHKRKHVRNPTMGKITAIFQQQLLHIDDLNTFSTLMLATSPLCSKSFEQQLLDRALHLLQSADPQRVTFNTLQFILQTLIIARNCYTQIIKICMDFLLPKVINLSISDLNAVQYCMRYLGFSHREMTSSIHARFLQALPLVDNIKDIVCLMEVLGPISSSSIKQTIEQKLLANVDEITSENIQSVCNGLRLMRHNLESQLILRIIQKAKRLVSELTVYDIIRLSECLKLVGLSPRDQIYDILRDKLMEILRDAITGSRVKSVAYCLSLIPDYSVSPRLLEKLDAMLPSYHAGDVHQIQKILKLFSERTCVGTEVQQKLASLNRRLESSHNVSDIQSIIYLHQFIDSLLSNKAEPDQLTAAMKHYSKCIVGLSPKMAVESAIVVSKTRYLQTDLLDRVAEVVFENLDHVSLNHILSTITPFCDLNYTPAMLPTFVETCSERFMPFLDVLEKDSVLHLAYLLSLKGCFPEPLIRNIFSVEFLLKMDNTVKVSAKRRHFNQYKLFNLNRTVVLQCPEYGTPWFHDKYCQENMSSLYENHEHHTMNEVKDFLTELCGGSQYIRTNVLTPYYYNMHFECLLDSDGSTLPCADYGSVLNKTIGGSIGTSQSPKWGVGIKQLPPGAQRVAIDFIFNSQYCLNSNHAKASVLVKKQNLEILGYKVVQIPYYEWNSPDLFETEDRLNYLQQLLFSDYKPDMNSLHKDTFDHMYGQQCNADSHTEHHIEKLLVNMDRWG